MVEAAIYFPITIGIVMVVLYFGLFKLQESYFFFQVERAATELAREASYPGYDSFTDENPLKNSKVDFDWENGPSESQTKSYYAAYKGSASKIYRWGVDSKLARRAADYQQALQKNSALFSIYFNGRAKTEIADGQRYKDQFAVTRTEDKAMYILRKDQSLQALHRAYFKKEPRKQNIYKTSPEEAAIEGEKWDKWLENIMDEIGGFENGL